MNYRNLIIGVVICVLLIIIVALIIWNKCQAIPAGSSSLEEYHRPFVDLPHKEAVNEYWNLVGFLANGELIFLDIGKFETNLAYKEEKQLFTQRYVAEVGKQDITSWDVMENQEDLIFISPDGKVFLQRLEEEDGWNFYLSPTLFNNSPMGSDFILKETRNPCLVGPLGYIESRYKERDKQRTANVAHLHMQDQYDNTWFLLHGWVSNSTYNSPNYPPHLMHDQHLSYYYLTPSASNINQAEGEVDFSLIAIIAVINRHDNKGLLVYQRSNGGRTELDDITLKREKTSKGLRISLLSAAIEDRIELDLKSVEPGRQQLKSGAFTLSGPSYPTPVTGRVVCNHIDVLG